MCAFLLNFMCDFTDIYINVMYLNVYKKRHWLIAFLFPVLLFSCQVRLAGAYDETVDTSIQKVSQDVSTLLVTLDNNLEGNRLKENKYELFRESYITILSELETLKIRSQSLAKYEKVTQMIVALNQNIKDMEQLHKIGFSNKRTLDTTKSLLETSLVNLLVTQNALKR
jgi:hypothetical protein